MPAPDLVEYEGVKMSSREKDNLLKGMMGPAVRRLSPGTKLFRVADATKATSGKSDDSGKMNFVDAEAGNWWFSQKALNKIMSYCVQSDEADRGLGYAAREALAVLFGWNDCDLLVEAYLAKNVHVFYGKGNPQGDSNHSFSGWKDIEQWFIPQVTTYEVDRTGQSKTSMNDFGKEVIKIYRTCSIRSVKGNAESYKE